MATIQERIDEGERISVYCHNPRCHHGSKLDLLKLRDKLGSDHGAMHDSLVPKLRCSPIRGGYHKRLEETTLLRAMSASASGSDAANSASVSAL